MHAVETTALPQGTLPSRALVIGWGNSLFADDGAGPRIAEEVSDWARPGVVALAVNELVPELAVDLAATRAAFFIDASLNSREVEVLPIPQTDEDIQHIDHALTPESLLTLSRQVFGRSPPAWLVQVPAENFTLGHGFSERTQAGIAAALAEIKRRL